MQMCTLYLCFRVCYPSCTENLMQRLILIALVATVAGAHVADVHAQDQTGETPLDTAIRNGATRMADLLRAHGGE